MRIFNFLRAKDEVEYKVKPWWASNAYVTLSYRFKGDIFWKRLYEFEYFPDPVFAPYGSYKSKTYSFREDGDYNDLKQCWTKERLLEQERYIHEQYERNKKEIKDENKKLSKNTSKRI